MAMDMTAAVAITAQVKGQQSVDDLNSALKATQGANDGVSASGKRLISSLERETQEFGKSREEILALRAAKLGVTDAAAPLITKLGMLREAANDAGEGMASFSFNNSRARRELIVLGHELSTGQYKRAAGSLQVLAEYSGGLGAIFSSTAAIIAGAAVVIGGLSYAVYKGAQESEKFKNTLLLTGNAAGLTEGRFRAMAKTLAAETNGKIGEAREALMLMTASGHQSADSFDIIGKAAIRFSSLSGESIEKVLKDFEGMNNGVAKWAAKHNESYNYLTEKQYLYIRQLEQQGKKEEAEKVTMQALYDHLGTIAPEQLGYLERAWRAMGTAKEWALGLGRDQTIDDKIAEQRSIMKAFKDPYNPGGYEKSDVYKRQKAALPALLAQKKAEEDAAAASANKARDERAKIEADEKKTKVDKGENAYKSELEGLQSRAARMKYDTDNFKAFGDKVRSADEATMEFEVTAGKFKGLPQREKQNLLEAAHALDTWTDSLAREKEQAKDREERDKKIKGMNLFDEKFVKDVANQQGDAIKKMDFGFSMDSFKEGAVDAFDTFGEKARDQAGQGKKAFADFFGGTENALLKFVQTGKLSFGSLTNTIIADLERIAIEQLMMKGMKSFLGMAGIPGFANGGIMSSAGSMPLSTYSTGGIASRPQVAIFGEGATPEAYVPLPDGRAIPVNMKGGGGAGNMVNNVNINIHGGTGQGQSSGDGRQAVALGQAIANAVQLEIIKQKRPGGLLTA